ncbi:VOC family protein [Nakamurella aerolata]|uniref:VOC family protein n=1 Tax=Nakamurella aerolata TaxID=1656892 RepID=A0A849A940_9ACTN|nr:VOC family protein [Nakamurella aerolata]
MTSPDQTGTSLTTIKDLVIDAMDPPATAHFWASALGGRYDDKNPYGILAVDGVPLRKWWVNPVLEAKTGKNRVHVDVYGDTAALQQRGATVVADQPDKNASFTVMADPGGNEFCVFPPSSAGAGAGTGTGGAPAEVFALLVDSAEPEQLASWWQGVIGGELTDADDGRPRHLRGAAGMDQLVFKFVPVADPKQVKNRWHWDVLALNNNAVDELQSRGATVLRGPNEAANWTVMADPQGNEFCVFPPKEELAGNI